MEVDEVKPLYVRLLSCMKVSDKFAEAQITDKAGDTEQHDGQCWEQPSTAMLKAALALCLLLAVCCAAPSTASRRLLTLEVDDRILGGEVANISDYPWMVSVEYLEAHRCGGTIVSSKWVMTVASCIWGTTPNNFALRVGTSTRGSGGSAYLATQLFWHDDYVPATSDKDIGFFQTTDSISFDDNVQVL
ncbi:trypsin-1-like [Schistocerca cancellata]|uniref:trypsin-1-like n=1 Tax=Schistocerca cancellata TaxID=274614 RepID=UPI0021196925|nr:trypsin-1-like [Schistocerca cancellata]